MATNNNIEVVTLGGGCYWCVEAVYLKLQGVISVVSGFAGGHTDHPTYEQVCNGNSGHAEVIQVTFDAGTVGIEEILQIFFTVHDPTTLNRQGADVGSQYRSVIFYHNDHQREVAQYLIAELDKSGAFAHKIVTEVAPITNFFVAPPYHQNYYNNNPNQSYCAFVIKPKLEKFKKVFGHKMKAD